jgi:hypothetical protein
LTLPKVATKCESIVSSGHLLITAVAPGAAPRQKQECSDTR